MSLTWKFINFCSRGEHWILLKLVTDVLDNDPLDIYEDNSYLRECKIREKTDVHGKPIAYKITKDKESYLH